jgi:phosphatidylglycerophosphate synthase
MTNPDDWSDLAKMWQADAARVPLAEIDAHLERERRHLRAVTIAEMAGLVAGIAAAALLLLFTPHVGMGVVIILFGGVSSWITLRMRRERRRVDPTDLMQSLKDSMEREDWMGSQLQLGRALSFVALFAIVSGLSVQLHQARAFSANILLAAGIGSAVVVAALAWNYVLARRSRRRRERLRYLHDRLKP